MKEYIVSHLVKSEDLNHHGTLFAGRSSEWLVEAAFIAAASEHKNPEDVLCVNIHGFVFKKPVKKGCILTLSSRVARVGKTSMTVYVKAVSEIEQQKHVDGFLTFVCVDSDTAEKKHHGLLLDEAFDAEEKEIRARANALSF